MCMHTDQIEWQEVQTAARHMFNVWQDRGDLEWAEEAWGHLRTGELVPDTDVWTRNRSLIRLITLGVGYRRFIRAVADFGEEPRMMEISEALLPLLDPVAIGAMAARLDTNLQSWAFSSGSELLASTLWSLTKEQWVETWEALKAAYGGDTTGLYTRLWWSQGVGLVGGEDDPEDQSTDHPLDLTALNMRGFECVDQLMME